jgi:hypothetical protein
MFWPLLNVWPILLYFIYSKMYAKLIQVASAVYQFIYFIYQDLYLHNLVCRSMALLKVKAKIKIVR